MTTSPKCSAALGSNGFSWLSRGGCEKGAVRRGELLVLMLDCTQAIVRAPGSGLNQHCIAALLFYPTLQGYDLLGLSRPHPCL